MIWFLYEKGKDVIVFNFGYNRYIIQARKHNNPKLIMRVSGMRKAENE